MRRWTENTKPICPMSLKSGDKVCYTQCLYAFKDGQNEANEQLFGCRMGDELDLRLELLTLQIAGQKKASAAPAKRMGRPRKVEVQNAE